MVRVEFAPAIQRHVACAPQRVEASTLRAALDAAFVRLPAVRPYVLDDQGALRRHVTVFIDGEQLRDRHQLGDTLRPDAEVYVVQALSGG